MPIGIWEIVIILAIAGVIFASSLPALGRFLGRSVFKVRKEIENHNESGQSVADRFWNTPDDSAPQDRQDRF